MAASFGLYEALRKHIPEEAARMIAEALAFAEQVATKSDIQRLQAELSRMETTIYRWMLTFFATLWLGMAGMIVTLALKL